MFAIRLSLLCLSALVAAGCGGRDDAREQEAIYLRCFERLPVDEITSLLSITGASGARGLLQSARRKLRAALAKPPGRKGSNRW